METIARWFVGHPLNIFIVAALFGSAWLIFRARLKDPARTRGLGWATLLWSLYALWEWAVITFSPEADMRVDLLLIWLVVGLVSLWGLWRLARGKEPRE